MLRLDPATRRVRMRIPVGGTPVSGRRRRRGRLGDERRPRDGAARSHLIKLDASSGRIAERVPVNGFGGAMATGAGGAVAGPGQPRRQHRAHRPGSSHGAPRSSRQLGGQELAVSGAVGVDARRRTASSRSTGRAAASSTGCRALAADGRAEASARCSPTRDGAWVVRPDGRDALPGRGRARHPADQGRGDRAGVRRARRARDLGRARRAARSTAARSCASTPTTARSPSGSSLGSREPQALVPVGKDLWVITSGGDAMLVSPA